MDPRSAEYTRPFLISESRAGERDAGLRPRETATSDVATAAPLGPPRSAIACMYSRSAGVARSYREPKKPTASSASATGAAIATSPAVMGDDAATSQVTLPYAWTKYG